MLEYQEVTPGKYYGIPGRTVFEVLTAGAARIADIEVLGAIELAAAYPQNVVQIFVTVPGDDIAQQMALLEARMRGRADEATILRSGSSARGRWNCLTKRAAITSW